MSIINDDSDPNRRQRGSIFRQVAADVALEKRPEFDLAGEQDLKIQTDETWRLLVETNTGPLGPDMYVRAGGVVRIEISDHGQPIICPMSQPHMIQRLAERIQFVYTKTIKGVEIKEPSKPPRDLATNLLVTPNPPLPILSRVVPVPIFCRDGHLHTPVIVRPAESSIAR